MADGRTCRSEASTHSINEPNAGGIRGPLLAVKSLVSGYGKKEVLHGVDLKVGPGEVVAVIGHNGAGKSTLLKAVFGMIPMWQGQVFHNGEVVGRLEPRQWLARGVAYVPQGNRVFGDLTVRENLEVSATAARNRGELDAGIDRSLAQYPQLSGRLRQRAGTLSGGEKQMLAVASALVVKPELLLLDEPSLGLAPNLIRQTLGHIREVAARNRVTVLIVEQKVREVLDVSDRVYVFRNGRVAYAGLAADLQDDRTLQNVYL